jgi:circadian clock protein KaiC
MAVAKNQRITTGIIGLDGLVEGGFVPYSINLITGKTGTGKTAFCTSFIRAGALEDEIGIYMTTEEKIDDIKGDAMQMFGWDFNELEKSGKIKFVSIRPELPRKTISEEHVAEMTKMYVYDIMSKIKSVVEKYKAKRLVIDSISIVEAFIRDNYMRKIALMQLLDHIKGLNVTALITGSVSEAQEGLSISGITESLVDGVIKLEFSPIQEEFRRTLTVRKMRRTNHSIFIHPFDITKDGLKIVEIV